MPFTDKEFYTCRQPNQDTLWCVLLTYQNLIREVSLSIDMIGPAKPSYNWIPLVLLVFFHFLRQELGWVVDYGNHCHLKSRNGWHKKSELNVLVSIHFSGGHFLLLYYERFSSLYWFLCFHIFFFFTILIISFTGIDLVGFTTRWFSKSLQFMSCFK